MTTAVEEWVSLGRAARILGVSLNVVRRLIDDRHLTGRRPPGGIWKVPVSEVEALAEKCTKPAVRAGGEA
jgi:excisionase family DNA binding protein